MDKAHMVEAAGKLLQVSSEAVEEYSGKSQLHMQRINEIIPEREDEEQLVGKGYLNM